jgi:hypothetical protein
MKSIYLLSSLLAFLIAFFTLSGDVQALIHFADPMNEIVFFTLCFATGSLLLMLFLDEVKEGRKMGLSHTGGLTGTTQSYFQDPEVGADRWEEERRLMEAINKETR